MNWIHSVHFLLQYYFKLLGGLTPGLCIQAQSGLLTCFHTKYSLLLWLKEGNRGAKGVRETDKKTTKKEDRCQKQRYLLNESLFTEESLMNNNMTFLRL